jgi:uncharacterized protein YodC (DUF2158 family)
MNNEGAGRENEGDRSGGPAMILTDQSPNDPNVTA